MVRGAIPGDDVVARVLRDHGTFVEAEVVSIEHASPDRRPTPCPIQPVCGGCPLMPADEAKQREAKRGFVVDALRRIGHLDVAVGEIVATPPALGYRNRVELTFGEDEGLGVLGYHRGDEPDRIVDVAACAIADPDLAPVLAAARVFFSAGTGRQDIVRLRARGDVRLVLRASGASGEKLIALRGPAGPFPSLAKFATAARDADPNVVGLVRIVSEPGRRGGARMETIAGRNWIAEEILGTPFRVPAATFLQVHSAAGAALGRHVLAVSEHARSVVELYGGIGGLGVALARRGSHATIVEADGDAVDCGREASGRAGVPTVRFVRDDVGRFLRRERAASPPELVIADPPRDGFGRGVAADLGVWGPDRLILVSCDPATMARDVAILVAHGYRVASVTPFDLFPQTAHVEAVVLLSRDADARTRA